MGTGPFVSGDKVETLEVREIVRSLLLHVNH